MLKLSEKHMEFMTMFYLCSYSNISINKMLNKTKTKTLWAKAYTYSDKKFT